MTGPRRLRLGLLALAFGGGFASCSRPAPSATGRARSTPEGGSSSSTASGASAGPSSVLPVSPPSTPPEPAFGPALAKRSTLRNLEDEVALRPFLTTLRERFPSGAGRFEVERVDLPGPRVGWLVETADEAQAVVLAVDRDQLLWSKTYPVAGIVPPVQHLTIAPRPDGGVVLFGYVASMHVVAARMWADDGNPYADIELASFEACDALTAGYAPGFGWIVACSSSGGARVQRLREDGTNAWPGEGLAAGATSASGPVTIVFDTPSSWVLVARVKGTVADHALAWRYDGQGRALWSAPADVGALPVSRVRLSEDRVEASALPDGAVRVELPRGLASKATVRAASIRTDGGVRWVSR